MRGGGRGRALRTGGHYGFVYVRVDGERIVDMAVLLEAM
jgi:hypothetical protein